MAVDRSATSEFVVIHEEDLPYEKAESPAVALKTSFKTRLLEWVAIWLWAVPFMAIFVLLQLPLLLVTNTYRFAKSLISHHKMQWVYPLLGPAGSSGSCGSLQMVIYLNDHPPPHFHVRFDGVNSKFDIETGECLGGSLPVRHHKKVEAWRKANLEKLRHQWSATRPR